MMSAARRCSREGLAQKQKMVAQVCRFVKPVFR